MSDTTAHISQAQHNESLASDLLSQPKYKDWLITVSFYSAVHYVEAKLASRVPPIHPIKDVPRDSENKAYLSIHVFREQLVKQYYKNIWHEYRMLRDISEKARYYCVLDTFTESAARDCLLIYLKKIKSQLGYL